MLFTGILTCKHNQHDFLIDGFADQNENIFLNLSSTL